MRTVLFGLFLLVLISSVTSCQSQYSVQMTVTQFRLTNESVQVTSGNPIEQSFSIMVSYEVTDENSEVSKVILAHGQFIDGELQLTQSITEPTEVTIEVYEGAERKSIGTDTVLRPDSTIEFVAVHRFTTYANYYAIHLIRNDHRSLNESMKFSIVGDFNQLNIFNPKQIEVTVHAVPSLVDGIGDAIVYGPILAVEGEFSVQGDLDAPTLFTVRIAYGSDFFRFHGLEQAHAILEPGVNYRIVPLGNQGKFAVVADRDSLHKQLVSSWQLDPEFVALMDTWVDNRLDATWGMDRQAEEKHENERLKNFQVAEHCAHMDLRNEVKSRFIERYKHAYEKTADQIVTMRAETLLRILQSTRDPDLVRMIFDLHWRLIDDAGIRSDRDNDVKVAMLRAIEQKMDQDYIDQYITPRAKYLLNEKRMATRNSSLRPGQVAPNFTLPTITGDEVSLTEVLSESELVLVDFWASWCDRCIGSFPAMKRMYAKYKDRGFEIITISIDDTLEAWEAVAKTLELPWIDLGDSEDGVMNGDSSPTADDYGVLWRHNIVFDNALNTAHNAGVFLTPERIQNFSRRVLPNRYLIDKEGCILTKRLSYGQLEEVLTSRWTDTDNVSSRNHVLGDA